VHLSTGPDGTLYIVDMYRGILQHKQYMTTYLRQQIEERELARPTGLGRIYRVVHESRRPGAPPRMSAESSGRLVTHLSHSNGWWRDTAQRLLVERQDQSIVPAVKQLAREGSEVARLHALWVLEGLEALDE